MQIIELVEALLLNFDFDGAQAKLAQCESVIATDYFLSSLTSPAEFMDAARRFIFETYCRIHEKIGLEYVIGCWMRARSGFCYMNAVQHACLQVTHA
jgi:hypothetical protein